MGWIIDILNLMKNSYIAIRVDEVGFNDLLKFGLQIECDVPNSVPNNVPKKCR